MKLASIRSDKRDGTLVLVSRDNQYAFKPVHPLTQGISLKEALERWDEISPMLMADYQSLCDGRLTNAFPWPNNSILAPIPNAPGFYDRSAFLSHVRRARQSRGDVVPQTLYQRPLMYQGVSDQLLSYNAPIERLDKSFGTDFEGEFAVIVSDVPRETPPDKMSQYIKLITFFNDITYRELIKEEIDLKFGFLQSKPNSSFAPLVVTPDELRGNWKDGRVHLELEVKLNGSLFGHPSGSEMHFSFFELVAHACRTRPLSAGSIVGSGTISNEDTSKGFACLTEVRCQELIETRKINTPWLVPGDRVEMDVRLEGVSVFGSIDEVVI